MPNMRLLVKKKRRIGARGFCRLKLGRKGSICLAMASPSGTRSLGAKLELLTVPQDHIEQLEFATEY